MGIQNSMTIDAYKLLVAALLLIKQHVCRAPDGHCLWQLQCRPGSSAGKPTRQGVSTTSRLRPTLVTDQDLLDQIQQAVQLVTPLFVEGNLLANLHVLRCIEAGEAIPKLDHMFFSRCFYAVSFSTGHQARQFNKASDPCLATSHDTLYQQSLLANHQRPERPTFLKDVSSAATFLKFVNAIVTHAAQSNYD